MRVAVVTLLLMGLTAFLPEGYALGWGLLGGGGGGCGCQQRAPVCQCQVCQVCVAPPPPRCPAPPICPPRLPPPPPPPPVNSCCCYCRDPCYTGYRAFGSKTFNPDKNNPLCNSKELRDLMRKNMNHNDMNDMKRAIQKAAEREKFGRVGVICAAGEFSYSTHTDTYCQTTKGDVTCYAFKND